MFKVNDVSDFYAKWESAYAKFDQGEFKAAYSDFETLLMIVEKENIQGNDDYNSMWASMGVCSYKLGDLESALRCFNKKIALGDLKRPDRLKEAWFNKALCHEDKGEYQEALNSHQNAEKITGSQEVTDDMLAYHLGICSFRLTRYDDAIRYFEKKITLKVEDPYCEKETWFFQGRCHDEKGEFQKAIDCFQEAEKFTDSKDSKEAAAIWFNMGVCCYQLGKFADAIRFFKQQIASVGSKRLTLLYMACSYEYRTEFLEAIDCYQKIIESSAEKDDQYHEAIYNKAGLHYRLGEHDVAAEVSSLVTDVYRQIDAYLPCKIGYSPDKLSMRHNVFRIFDVHPNDVVKVAVVKHFAIKLRKFGPKEISFSFISDTALSTFINHYPYVTTLEATIVSSDSNYDVVKALARRGSLTSLSCILPHPTMEMMKILATSSSLTSLRFSNDYELKDDVCMPLYSMTTLRILDLSYQDLSDVTAIALSKATWLRKLDLSGNSDITYVGAIRLEGNTSLTALNLERCDSSINMSLLNLISRNIHSQQNTVTQIMKERIISPVIMLILNRHIMSKEENFSRSLPNGLPIELLKKIFMLSTKTFFSELFPKNERSIQGLIDFIFANADNLLVLIRQRKSLRIIENIRPTMDTDERHGVRPGISSKHVIYVHTFRFFHEPMQLDPTSALQSHSNNKRGLSAASQNPNAKPRMETDHPSLTYKSK